MWTRTRSRDFHESYYEHSCAVVAERDVLDTDIHGNIFRARLQRWWHDLFLLSYSDERSRIYYSSSYAMRKDRQRHFRKFCGRIHPLSKFRTNWDFMMLLVFMANKLTFHHNTSFIFGDVYRSFYYIGAGLELIIIADLFINLATGYIDQQVRKVVLDKRAGILYYCSTRLFFHVASAMPLQWLLFVRYGSKFDCTLCKATQFTCCLEIISICDLFRLYECSKYWVLKRRGFKISYFLKFLRIAVIALFTMFQFMELADIVTLRVMVDQGHIVDNSYVGILLRNKYGKKRPSDTFLFFIFDFARICKSILLFSFAYRNTTYYIDRMISLIAYMIANIFYLWTVTECFALICHLKFSEDRLMVLKNATVDMGTCRQLSDKVTAKLNSYFEFNFSKLKAVETHNHLYRALPLVLKKEQFLASHYQFITRIPYFAEWPMTMKRTIVHMLKEEIYLKHDMVAELGVSSEGLCIVASGELVVYSKQKETGHLIDGDYFGELSLVTDREIRTSSIVAVTACLILILSKASFRRYMRTYPNLFFRMKHQLKGKFGGSNTSSQQSRFGLDADPSNIFPETTDSPVEEAPLSDFRS